MNFKVFMNGYINYTAKPYYFPVNDTTLLLDNSLYFKKINDTHHGN